MDTLCYVGIPQKWESPKGVMIRTAYHNGYSTVAAMCAALGVPYIGDALDLLTEHSPLFSSLTMAAPDMAHLLLANSYTVNNTSSRSWIIDEISLYRSQFARHFMYCPKCLLNEVISIFQDIRDLQICPLHRAKIITHCPNCNVREHWTTANLFFCRCGSDRRLVRSNQGRLFGKDRLETFGPNADIRDLSYTTYIAQTCEDIWISRKSTEDVNLSLLKDIRQHAIRMIRRQHAKYPGFTQMMHLSPWRFSHPMLVSISNEISEEPGTFNEKCYKGSCCGALELTLSEVVYSLKNRKKSAERESFIACNFESNRYKKKGIPYYRCNVPICNLIRTTNENYLESETKSEPLSDNLEPLAIQLEQPQDECLEARLGELLEKTLNNSSDEPADFSYLTTKKSAALLHCSKRTILELAKAGYLSCFTMNPKRRRLILFSKSAVEHFNENYTFIMGISLQLSTTPIFIIRALDKIGLKRNQEKSTPHLPIRSEISFFWDELVDEVVNFSPRSLKVCCKRITTKPLVISRPLERI